MTYGRFEDTPVWQTGIDLAVRAFVPTEDTAFRFKGDLANQLQRAALSVPNNVAEGFERGTTPELITFLYYAKGSAGEVRSVLAVADRLPYLSHLRSEISDLRSLAESASRQLAAWAQSLQNSDIPGHRHLTDRGRAVRDQQERAATFLARLNRMNAESEERRRTERASPSEI
jgi:four helix bundle protein